MANNIKTRNGIVHAVFASIPIFLIGPLTASLAQTSATAPVDSGSKTLNPSAIELRMPGVPNSVLDDAARIDADIFRMNKLIEQREIAKRYSGEDGTLPSVLSITVSDSPSTRVVYPTGLMRILSIGDRVNAVATVVEIDMTGVRVALKDKKTVMLSFVQSASSSSAAGAPQLVVPAKAPQ